MTRPLIHRLIAPPAIAAGWAVLLVFRVLAADVAVARADPPRMLQLESAAAAPDGRPQRVGFAIMRLPDGNFAFYDRLQPAVAPLVLTDQRGHSHTLLPALPESIRSTATIVSSGVLNNTQVLRTGQRQVTSIFVRGERLDRETAERVGLPRYLDVWRHQVSATEETGPSMIWRGYNGSQMEYEQLPSGRILVPFGSFQPHGQPVPPHGRHKTIVLYSDDAGVSWNESASQLISPCYAGFNGNNEGACEPVIERLQDGRIWMLMRTQAGFLYESFSSDQGTSWSAARASRFHTSTGPANIMRHRDGALVVCWNNCELPPRVSGEGVYGGRDALHIAVSHDDGQSWRGFREIYLDHRRNDNPAKSGDRGTAYPLAGFTSDGLIVVIAGQGAGGRLPILIDPDWITADEANTDFSDGLGQWSVYKHHGPATNWWRARGVGAALVTNPTDPTASSLLIRRPDRKPADGATWNFPNAWSGTLTARILLRDGSSGGSICLNDRFFDPTNDFGEQLAVFRWDFDQDVLQLRPESWHDVAIRWNLPAASAQLWIDGQPLTALPIRNETINGISYVRFRSSATQTDQAGFLVDSVRVKIDDPYAPPIDAAIQRRHEQRYIQRVVPTWQSSEN